MEGLPKDAAKKSSSSSTSKRPVGAGRYELFPEVDCSGFWGSFSDGADVLPNTSASPVGRGARQPRCEPVWVGFLALQ